MMSDNVDKNYHNGDNKKMGVRMCTREGAQRAYIKWKNIFFEVVK